MTTATRQAAYRLERDRDDPDADEAAGRGRQQPEFRLAADALRGAGQDLFHDAFAYRPLPRMRVDGPLARRLPERVKEYAAWTPHAVITA